MEKEKERPLTDDEIVAFWRSVWPEIVVAVEEGRMLPDIYTELEESKEAVIPR